MQYYGTVLVSSSWVFFPFEMNFWRMFVSFAALYCSILQVLVDTAILDCEAYLH